MSETTTLEEAPQTEAVTETQAEEQKQATGLDDPMLSQLWEDLGVEPAPEVKPDEPEVQPEVQPELEAQPEPQDDTNVAS